MFNDSFKEQQIFFKKNLLEYCGDEIEENFVNAADASHPYGELMQNELCQSMTLDRKPPC